MGSRAPASVIGKFPAAVPDSRRAGSAHLLYLREVSFYRELAHTLAIHTPRPFVAEIDPETDDFILILEDLAPFRQVDQLAGCSLRVGGVGQRPHDRDPLGACRRNLVDVGRRDSPDREERYGRVGRRVGENAGAFRAVITGLDVENIAVLHGGAFLVR